MEDEDKPILISTKPLPAEFSDLQKIVITSEYFTVGRGLKNSAMIPFLSISRNHCIFRKTGHTQWVIEDNSSLGITINKCPIKKGKATKLSHGDIIILEPSEVFVYKFKHPGGEDNIEIPEVPTKRMKLSDEFENSILNNVKKAFEQSQNCEIKHIQEKIKNAQQLQTASMAKRQTLQLDIKRIIKQLDSEYELKISNLKGEANEIENQKALLIEEKNKELACIKNEAERKIAELIMQTQKHNEIESELVKENNLLKEKLKKEREDFLLELSRESSSKQDMLNNLEAKIHQQEEVRLKERQEFEETLKKETEQIRIAKEKELKQLEEQKKQRELELEQELNKIKNNLKEQVEQTEQQRLKAEEQLNRQMEQMKKLSDEEKIKMEQLLKEREEIQNQLSEAQSNAEKSLAELRKRVADRETELAALAADRIQKQAEQSTEVITTLQEQLEKVKSQLQLVESEKNTLLETVCSENTGEGSSKQTTLTEVGEIIESELQCSICAELFIEATTLNCSHTFCKYCITMWKEKKKDCPICRTRISSECRSLVLDTFIEKMVQNLTEEMKVKRKDILNFRAELVSEMARQTAGTSRGGLDYEESETSDDYLEEEADFYSSEFEDYDSSWDGGHWSEPWGDSSGGSDDASDAEQPARAPARAAAAAAALAAPHADAGRERRRRVAGVPGAYYGGYGRCFSCGARGHWAPGCPFR